MVRLMFKLYETYTVYIDGGVVVTTTPTGVDVCDVDVHYKYGESISFEDVRINISNNKNQVAKAKMLGISLINKYNIFKASIFTFLKSCDGDLIDLDCVADLLRDYSLSMEDLEDLIEVDIVADHWTGLTDDEEDAILYKLEELGFDNINSYQLTDAFMGGEIAIIPFGDHRFLHLCH